MITLPRSNNKKWSTSYRGEYLGDITNTFGIDLFSSQPNVRVGKKFYPHTTGTLSGSSLTPPADLLTANISNGVSREVKTWGVADNKVIIRSVDGSAFVKDTSTGFTAAENTGFGSDLLSVTDETEDVVAVTEVAIAQGSGAFAITGTGNNTKWAQSFTQVQGPFKSLSFYAKKVSSPSDNLIVEIQSDNAGTPSGTVLSSLTLSATGFTTSFVQYTYENTDWSTPALQLNLDSVYHIVFRRSGSSDTVNYIELRSNLALNETDDPYKNGQLQQYNGSTWTRTVTYTRTDTFTADGTWTVPANVTSATVECWASGGNGINNTGGGGGGAYSRSVLSLTPGNKHGITVGLASNYLEDGTASAFNGVQVLAVGGGGSGGRNGGSGTRPGGGGGGGGVVQRNLGIGVGTYAITIGDGGAPSGVTGGDTTFAALITAKGGGGGGTASNDGSNGASGGGSPQASNAQGTGIPGQGYDGGDGYNTDKGGGGGGAGGTGTTPTASVAGDGGPGKPSSITGVLTYYGGGGGGGGAGGAGAGTGGTGGGGNGANSGNGSSATANTGGGGGGSASNGTSGGQGGKGVVIVRYRSAAYTATGGTITTDGDYKVHTFTSSGTFEITAVNYSRVLAAGGKSGYNGGAGGLTADGIGDVKYSGGNGYIGTGDRGGGGGAGDSGNGQDSGSEIGGGGGLRQGGEAGGKLNTTWSYYGSPYGGGGSSRTGGGYPAGRGEVRITYNVTEAADYPNVIGRFFGRNSYGTSQFYTFPTDIIPGETLLLVVSADNNGTISKSGWTVLSSKITPTSNCAQTILYKVATGDDDGSFASSINTSTTYIGYRIKNAGTPTATLDANLTGNPPSHSTGLSGKQLWIATYTATQDTTATNNPTAAPTNYTSFIMQPEEYNYDEQNLKGARTAVAERLADTSIEDPGAFTGLGDSYGVFGTIAIPYQLDEFYVDASVSLQVEFPEAAERLYVSTTRDVKFLNQDNGIWQSLWMGVLQKDALDSNYPHPMKLLSAGGLIFVGDGNKLHSFIATATNATEATENRLVFDATHYINWIQVTKSAVFIGLANKLSDSLPSYVCYYEPNSEITRIFTIEEGATVGFIVDENCQIIDKAGQMRYYNGSAFLFYDAMPPYYAKQKVTTLPHRNGIVVKDKQVHILWEGQYPWGAGIWVYEDGRLYHRHPFVFDKVNLNSFGAVDGAPSWKGLYYNGTRWYAGASVYESDNTTENKGVYSDTKISGVTVESEGRGYIKTPKFGSSQRDSVWQRVFAKIEKTTLEGTATGDVKLKYRQDYTPIGESVYAPAFTGTWTSPTTFTTTTAAFKTAVDSGEVTAGNEVIIRRGQGAGLRATIVSIAGTTTRTVTIDEGLSDISSGSMTFSIENWRYIPNKDLVGSNSEWLQVKAEIRDEVELEELQITSDNNETNVE